MASSADTCPAAPARAGAPRLPWPLPALLAWLGAWALALGLLRAGWPAGTAWAAGAAAGVLVALAMRRTGAWRRVLVAAGFPSSALASGLAAGAPAWSWLLPLALGLAAYPLRAWRDAPLFPTPADALVGLDRLAPLAPGARVLDAGCGLGHGLAALRRVYPQARLEGVEWSWPLRLAAGWRCPWARVRRGDLWAGDWSGLDLVYLFQRPESMARAHAKACAEMAPGTWLASLDFAVPEVAPAAVLRAPGRQPVWLYRMPGRGDAAQPARLQADNPPNKPARQGRR